MSAPALCAEPPRWSPLVRPAVPAVKARGAVANPVDAFVIARLESQGLAPAARADRETLLRRVTFDLTGLSPTDEERRAFLADDSPFAYEKVVDRLLQSPRFGERWAQHWLDVVRYAETDGFKLDHLRPDAHRYRDYVIQAFNKDMPYDRFIAEQLAGDEIDPDNPEARIATGFLRLYPEETNGSNYHRIRQDIFDDITDVFGTTFLGLTLSCARCHDHKFDPIRQREYYELQAFFTPLLARDVPLVDAAEQARWQQQQAAWEAATRELREQVEALLAPLRKDVFGEFVVVFDEQTQQALKTPAGERTPVQEQLVALGEKQILRAYRRSYRRLKPAERERYDRLQVELKKFDDRKPAPLPTAMSVTEVGTPPTHRLAGGSYLKPREEVQPRFPRALDSQAPDIHARSSSTGRRTALARWLCRPDHPLTSRVLVNRLWQHYFGRGIVATPNDFGAAGSKATHPELLDYLASELSARGWRLKTMHRLIVTSATYCQASSYERGNPAFAVDPGNRLLWHAPRRRRDAESIRDTILQASGELNRRMYGPSACPELPASVYEDRYAWYADERVADRNRRSIYVVAKRNLSYPLLAAFDLPDRVNSCPERPTTVTAPQALVMFNGEVTSEQARLMASRLLTVPNQSRRQLVETAFRRVYGKQPTPSAVSMGEHFLDMQTTLIAGHGAPPPETMPPNLPGPVDRSFAAAVADLCHALLNSAEFLYVD